MNKYSEIRGYFLHAFDLDKAYAEGYLGPPSKEVTKLINLSVIRKWEVDRVRTLIHPDPVYIDGYQPKVKFLYNKWSWDECPLRCLHVRFLSRSSKKESTKKNC